MLGKLSGVAGVTLEIYEMWMMQPLLDDYIVASRAMRLQGVWVK